MTAPVEGPSADVIVVGAGPAGRSLAYRAAAAGLRATLVDPAPHRVWRQTFGMYADDAPAWLDPGAVAARSAEFCVFTPQRRVVDRGYLVLHSERFQQSLSLSEVTVVASSATALTATSVTLADGSVLAGRHVVDARGTAGHRRADTPRQTAVGFLAGRVGATDGDDPDTTVLMDWRPADTGPNAVSSNLTSSDPASFSYRIDTARGRLVEETCLAARPPLGISELARRARLRLRLSAPTGDEEVQHGGMDEIVDFPMYPNARPWRGDGALAIGAVGGRMNPATGYSVAQSLRAADLVVEAVAGRRDPRAALWPRAARIAFTLRLLGLLVLIRLRPAELVGFFDAFFGVPVPLQRAYVSSHADAPGVLRAMAAVFRRCPPRLKARVAVASARAAVEVVRLIVVGASGSAEEG
ncbi:lycopene cyclase family protein [Gordonia sp. PS3]|uniref:lycopene cyclase family protein n=1 Tax=Gordonia TaxID=2053 RepID=UPI001C931968|nr:lycopene cyclase family protein [Gordonia sihwensis]MBY4568603.1 lycopene beta cyclase [Gordonia sihwensis]